MIILPVIFVVVVVVIVLSSRQSSHSSEKFERRNYEALRGYQTQISRQSSEVNNPKTDIRKKLKCSQEIIDCYSRLQSFCSRSRGGEEWFRQICSYPVSQSKEAVADYTKLLSELEEFHTSFFPIVSPDEKIQSDWAIIHCDHNSYDQLNRQKRSIRTLPVYINHNARCGFFLSSDMESIYTVFLFSCTCPDYEKRGLPCKHMYRLFYELTVGTIYTTGISGTDSDETAGFLKLSDQNKVSYIKFVRSLIDRGNRPLTTRKFPYIKEALESSLLLQSDLVDYVSLMNNHTKDEIMISLRNSGITDCYPSWTKVRIMDYIVEHHKQYLKKEYKDFVAVMIPPALESWCSGFSSVIDSSFSYDTESLREWENKFEKFI